MAFTFGNVTEGSTKTPTHNNNGEDVYIFASYGLLGTAPNNEDMTYGGRTCHFICEYADAYFHGTLWVCLNAPTGSNVLQISDTDYNASTPWVLLVSVTGAKQAVPTSYNGQIGNTSSSSRDITSAAGHKVLDFIRGNTLSGGVYVAGAGQTEIRDDNIGSSHEDGAGTVTMSWTFPSTRFIHIGVDLPPDDGTIFDVPSIPTVGNTGQGTSSPLSYNCNGDILCVGVFDGEGSLGTVSGVTFNGVALTSLFSESDGNWLGHFWYLLNPPQGTYNIAVTMGSGTLAKILVASIQNCSVVAPTIYNGYAGLNSYPENDLVCSEAYLVLDMVWGRVGITRELRSGQTMALSDVIAYKRGAVDYWSRWYTDTRECLLSVAFRGLGGRTLQIPALIG